MTHKRSRSSSPPPLNFYLGTFWPPDFQDSDSFALLVFPSHGLELFTLGQFELSYLMFLARQDIPGVAFLFRARDLFYPVLPFGWLVRLPPAPPSPVTPIFSNNGADFGFFFLPRLVPVGEVSQLLFSDAVSLFFERLEPLHLIPEYYFFPSIMGFVDPSRNCFTSRWVGPPSFWILQ